MTKTYLSPEDKSSISKKINEVYEQAKELFPSRLRSWTRPGWDTDMSGVVAGLAYFNQNKMKFNPVLFLRNKEEFLNDTVPHEMAHLIAYKVYGDTTHGEGWQKTMIALGYPPTRCHRYQAMDLKRTVTITKHYYTCACKTRFELSQQRHRKMIATKFRAYQCGKCKSYLINLNQKIQFRQ
jgi:SprT protein